MILIKMFLKSLYSNRNTYLLVYLIIRVENLHTKFEALGAGLKELGMTIYVNLVMYQAGLESVMNSIMSLFRGSEV